MVDLSIRWSVAVVVPTNGGIEFEEANKIRGRVPPNKNRAFTNKFEKETQQHQYFKRFLSDFDSVGLRRRGFRRNHGDRSA